MNKIMIFLSLFFISFKVYASGWEVKPVDSLIMDKRISEIINCHEKKCDNNFKIFNDYDNELVVNTGVDSNIMILVMINLALIMILITIKGLIKIYDKEN